jgi:hypothetical protein
MSMESMELKVSITEALTVARMSMSANALMAGGGAVSSAARSSYEDPRENAGKPSGPEAFVRGGFPASVPTGIYCVLW